MKPDEQELFDYMRSHSCYYGCQRPDACSLIDAWIKIHNLTGDTLSEIWEQVSHRFYAIIDKWDRLGMIESGVSTRTGRLNYDCEHCRFGHRHSENCIVGHHTCEHPKGDMLSVYGEDSYPEKYPGDPRFRFVRNCPKYVRVSRRKMRREKRQDTT